MSIPIDFESTEFPKVVIKPPYPMYDPSAEREESILKPRSAKSPPHHLSVRNKIPLAGLPSELLHELCICVIA